MIELKYAGTDGCTLYAFGVDEPSGGATADRPPLILMHGGGPDHRSLVPLAKRLSADAIVVLPDVRGYGRSLCRDPKCHTWGQYADDVVSLLDHLEMPRAVIGGAGLGTTISLRTAVAHPDRVSGLVLISVEDIEDDAGKAAETAFMDAFAERVRTGGVNAGWDPILTDLSPIVGAMVREAMLDADAPSLAAAAAIGRDRAFRGVEELLGIDVPVLLFAGADWRHPAGLARELARRLPQGRLGTASMSSDLLTTEDFARAFALEISEFMRSIAVLPAGSVLADNFPGGGGKFFPPGDTRAGRALR
jgi:pimeloyl-ACP methyl ester carboxylesterase